MKLIRLYDRTGSFAENKDVARDIRIGSIIPALENNENVTLDFSGVDSATQSFIHALISAVLRQYGSEILDRISFKSCNETIKKIITIVVEYMHEST
jgi:DNA-binding IscR family transcriptional regulator